MHSDRACQEAEGTVPAELQDALAEHQSAIEAFAVGVRHLPERAWATPVRANGWTPAQMTEHLCLACEAFLRELLGDEGLRLRTGWIQRSLLRAVFLRRILRTRQIPRPSRAPRELAPITVASDRISGLTRLAECATALDTAARAAPARGVGHLTHHLFGRLDLAAGIRFCAIHVEHHQRQLG